jgi:hypothetical protein
VRIVSPADGSRVGGSFRIVATATTDEQLASVTATVADRSFPLAFADGAWSGAVDVTGLFGSQTVTVSARSALGAVGTASAAYVHDAPPSTPPAPAVRIVSPADGGNVGATFPISATVTAAEAVTSVTATVADRSFALAFAGGAWSGTVDMTGLFGSHTVTVTARSASGAAGTASATYVHDAPVPPPPPPVKIVSPADGSVVATSFVISATVTSSEAVTGVAAVVAGRSTALAWSGGKWSGTVSFAGLAGSHTVTVTASSASGVLGTASATYTRGIPPTVHVESPVSFQVGSSSIRVKATCSDDGPAGCASLVVRVAKSTTALAQGTGSVDANPSLPGPSQLTLEFVGRDSDGLTATVTREVYVETSSAWSHPAHGPGVLLDADAGRLLAASGGQLQVQTRSTGAVQTIFEDAGTVFPQGRLTPRGAIFVEGPDRTRVRDWRDGAIVTMPAISVRVVEVAGDWALWHNGSALIRRDLQAGTNVVVSTSAGNIHNDVAANGDVVFWEGATYDVSRYRGGATTLLTSTQDPGRNAYPVTDGTNTVFAKRICCTNELSQTMLIGPTGGEVALTDANRERAEPGPHYQVAGGWIAFTRVDSTGVVRVWRRAPDGTLTQLTTGAQHGFVVTLGANGDVVYSRGLDRFAVKPGGSPVPVGSNWGRPVWIGGVLHNILGASVFRIDY